MSIVEEHKKSYRLQQQRTAFYILVEKKNILKYAVCFLPLSANYYYAGESTKKCVCVTYRQSSWRRAVRAGQRRRGLLRVEALWGDVDCGRTDDERRERSAVSFGVPSTFGSETKPTPNNTQNYTCAILIQWQHSWN